MIHKYFLKDLGKIETLCVIEYYRWDTLVNTELPGLSPDDCDGYNIVAEEELNNDTTYRLEYIVGRYEFDDKAVNKLNNMSSEDFVIWVYKERSWSNFPERYRTPHIFNYFMANKILPYGKYLINVSW